MFFNTIFKIKIININMLLNYSHLHYIYEYFGYKEMDALCKTCKLMNNLLINIKYYKKNMYHHYLLRNENFIDNYKNNNYIKFEKCKTDTFTFYIIKIYISSASYWCFESNSSKCNNYRRNGKRCNNHFANFSGNTALCEIVSATSYNDNDEKCNINNYVLFKKYYYLLVERYNEFNDLSFNKLYEYIYSSLQSFIEIKNIDKKQEYIESNFDIEYAIQIM